MKDLENLIKKIIILHDYITEKWPLDDNYQKLNMVKTKVHDVYDNQDIFLRILKYREFLIKNNVEAYFKGLNEENIEARIKNKNSIQFKIENYTIKKEHEFGHIPLKKCLNDIFGIRIIIDKLTQEDIWLWLKENYSFLKVTNSNKDNYRAIHVYFGNGNNNIYQWELQIWLKEDKENNYISHAKYKQDYIKWEKGD